MHLASQQVIKMKLEKHNRFQTPGLHRLLHIISVNHHSCGVTTDYLHYIHGIVPEQSLVE